MDRLQDAPNHERTVRDYDQPKVREYDPTTYRVQGLDAIEPDYAVTEAPAPVQSSGEEAQKKPSGGAGLLIVNPRN